MFDSAMESEENTEEHSSENHMYFRTYHFKNDLQSLTEFQLRQLVLDIVKSVLVHNMTDL